MLIKESLIKESLIKKSLIKNNSLQIINEISSWEEAIKIASLPLIEAGVIEKRYCDAMIEVTKKNGPYYILGENVAIPHSKPSDGVIQTGFSLLILKKPVSFDVEDFDARSADTILVLAINQNENKNKSQDVIRELLNLIEDSEKLKKLRSSTKNEEILALFD